MIQHKNMCMDRADFEFGDKDFIRVSQIAKMGWGLHLDESKRPLIRSRLSKRIKFLKLSEFSDYFDLIEGGDLDERKHFVAALTTNVTHFYREVHHFDFLEREILPGLLSRAKAGERIRIWSAGCSSGKEPFSLAGSIMAIDANANSYDLKILATDVDSNVLQEARSGMYAIEDSGCPTDTHRTRLFEHIKNDTNEMIVRPELHKMVTFRELNLFEDWPMRGAFDIIMCRNVAIYFDKPTQALLWKKFCDCLRPQGHLLIGHSERVNDPEKLDLSLCAITTYQLQSTQ